MTSSDRRGSIGVPFTSGGDITDYDDHLVPICGGRRWGNGYLDRLSLYLSFNLSLPPLDYRLLNGRCDQSKETVGNRFVVIASVATVSDYVRAAASFRRRTSPVRRARMRASGIVVIRR
jgi:hypothetical protein